VNAVGHPYAGARTTVGGTETIRVLDVTALPDMPFEIRDEGKIWRLDNGRPTVVCGSGMLRIDSCLGENGSEFLFQRLRSGLGQLDRIRKEEKSQLIPTVSTKQIVHLDAEGGLSKTFTVGEASRSARYPTG